MAASIVFSLPSMLLYLAVQRSFVPGIVTTGLKWPSAATDNTRARGALPPAGGAHVSDDVPRAALAAMRYQEPDHVPLVFNVAGFRPPAQLAWSSEYEEAQRWLSLGADASLRVHAPDLPPRGDRAVLDGERAGRALAGGSTCTRRPPARPPGGFLSDDWVAANGPSTKAERPISG